MTFQADLLSDRLPLVVGAVAAGADNLMAGRLIVVREDYSARPAVRMAQYAEALGQFLRIAGRRLGGLGEVVAGEAVVGPDRLGNRLVRMAPSANLVCAGDRHRLRRQVALPANRPAGEVQFVHMIAFNGGDLGRHERRGLLAVHWLAAEHRPAYMRRCILTTRIQTDDATAYCD